jgi:hypothetical protein
MISDRGVDRDGVAKIADFGVAKLISHEATHQRALMGTPSYMSPEQLEGVAVGGASDQFALAVVVYEVLTGEKPFAAEHLAALHYFICKRPARPPKDLNATLSETVNRVMERALAKLPEERYSSCGEFIGVLSVALGECQEWQPVAPHKNEEPEKPAGNGWYAPETVVTSRLIESSHEGEQFEEAQAIDPVVLPPSADVFDNSLSTLLVTDSERKEYESAQRGADLAPRTDGTKIRIGIDPPTARHFGAIMAACAAVALLGILLLRFLSNPRANTQDQESKRIVTVVPPEDLSAVSKQAVSSPADLTTLPAATPVAPVASPSSATTVVPAPNTRQGPATPLPFRPVPGPAATVSDVELVSDPPGARVVVDGRADLSCLAPCTVPLVAGRHTLSADLGGYGIARKIFNAPAAGSVFVSMMRNMGMLLLTSEPAGTSVIVDGRDLGPTPVKVLLAAGRHHLSLSDGLRHHDETIQIDTDGVYARSFRW